jgi:hypothetical protein
MVYRGFRSLSPAGLLINDVEIGSDRILIVARCHAAAGVSRLRAAIRADAQPL